MNNAWHFVFEAFTPLRRSILTFVRLWRRYCNASNYETSKYPDSIAQQLNQMHHHVDKRDFIRMEYTPSG